MGPECSSYHKGSGLCIIATGHPHQLHRVLKNTEVKERNSTIYRHVFRCSTAHQCSLVQSGYGMAIIYTQAIVIYTQAIVIYIYINKLDAIRFASISRDKGLNAGQD